MKKVFSIYMLISAVVFSVESSAEEEHDPAEIAIGERLTLETRFSQAYFANPEQSDPVLDKVQTIADPMPGIFAGKTISCRACHMVDELADKGSNPVGGMRTYADFARRSPIPARSDGQQLTPRNSMTMVNISQAAYSDNPDEALFHHDGQFNSMTDLVKATLTGRNFGWLPGEAATAIKHVAAIIRNDDGSSELAKEFGGSYKKIFTSKDKNIAAEFKLSSAFSVDVEKASDEVLFNAVAKLISSYVTDLAFSKNENDEYDGSAYDLFLKKNNLPLKPAKDETKADYSSRLLVAVEALKKPVFVKPEEKKLETHKTSYGFAEKELQGMKLFFRRGTEKQNGGNCISCHSAPDFSDFKFHNTGLTAQNYDSLHGEGSFAELDIPGLAKRNGHYNRYLPATEEHPEASSRYRQMPVKNKPGYTDLGLWNVFANPDMPAPQKKISKILCEQAAAQQLACNDEQLLKLSIAAFKTPVLRDLEHSGPYFHNGQADVVAAVMSFYRQAQQLVASGNFPYMSPEMKHVVIDDNDVEALLAFMQTLNEDYD